MMMTDGQKRAMKGIHEAFSRKMVRARAIPKTGGQVHVWIETAAGLWEWTLTSDGDITDVVFTQPLFTEKTANG